MAPELCSICNKRILSHSLFLHCGSCSGTIHRNCASLNREQYDSINQNLGWICKPCISSALPFNHLDNDQDFLNAVYSNSLEHFTVPVDRFCFQCFNPFETNETEDNLLFGDIDPDSMFFNEISHSINSNSNYYMENSFNDYIKKNDITGDSFAMIHLNIRSIPKNMSKFVSYMSNINFKFPIMGFTETFLTEENNSCYEMTDYKHFSLPKSSSLGHGVSLYVDSQYNCELYPDLIMLEDHIECIFAKITMYDMSVIVGVVYRPPNSNLNNYLDAFINITESLKKMNKFCYIMEDMNLDLMKYE